MIKKISKRLRNYEDEIPRITKRITTELDIRDQLAGLYLRANSNAGKSSANESNLSFIIELQPGMDKVFEKKSSSLNNSHDNAFESMDVDYEIDSDFEEDEVPTFKIPDMFLRKYYIYI